MANEKEIYADLELPPAAEQRPFVLVNMVSSVDGRASRGGKASGIGSRSDRAAMRVLRSRVDAVMVGAGTLRAERLNLGLDDPEARQPLAVIVGGAGNLPVSERLVLAPGQEVVLVSPERHPPIEAEPLGQRLSRVLSCPGRDPGRADLDRLLRTLRSEHGVNRLLVEGGPGLNRALIEACLVDELFLTVAPKMLLGPEAAIFSGYYDDEEPTEPRHLTLVSVHSANDEIFLRYRLDHPKP